MTLKPNSMKYRLTYDFTIDFLKLIKYLFNRHLSAFFIVFGRRGTGKTDFSLYISEAVKGLDLVGPVATNIKIYDSPFFDIDFIDNLDDLTAWARGSAQKKLYIFDEAGQSLPRRSPMSKIVVEWIKKLQIVRKYKLCLLFVTPDEKYLDSTNLGSDILDGVFRKPDGFGPQKNALYKDTLQYFKIPIHNIPRTIIKFDTWDSAEFTLHRKITKKMFEARELQILWERANGKKLSEIGLHPQAYKRLELKYLRLSLNYFITHHKDFREVDSLKDLSPNQD